MNRQARLSIDTVTSLDHVVLNVTAYSVLGTEERSQLNVVMLMQQVRRMTKPMIHGRLITDQPDPLTSNTRIALFK
jgi:hypothetical protein